MGSRMDARLSIAVVAAVFFAASAFPGISAGLEGYSPGHLVLLRFLMASFVLAIYAMFSGIRLSAARHFRWWSWRAFWPSAASPRLPERSYVSHPGEGARTTVGLLRRLPAAD
jgi:type VI protein secretion system component VasK